MLRALVLALVLLSATGITRVPASPTAAVAPVEVLAEGFGQLRGIALDGDDVPYVADREWGTVTRLAADGHRVIARRLERPVGLAIDPHGRVLVAEERGGRVVRLDPRGPTLLAQGIRQPRWLAVSDTGTVYVSARQPARDAVLDDEAVEPETIFALSPDGLLTVFADGFDHLQGLAVHGDAVYAATTGPRGVPRQGGVVYRIPILPDGQAGRPVRVGPRDVFDRPVGLAVDRRGALYASAAASILDGPRAGPVIVKVRADGAASTFATGLGDPRGLAVDRRGHLYLADGNVGRVLRFLAPPAPTLASLAPFTKLASLPLTGSTAPHARVDALVNDEALAVTTTATATGAFALTLTPAPNAANRVEVVATGARGRGLSSPPGEARFVHDTIAPALVLMTPPPGAFVSGTVEVRADAADTGSQLAALSVSPGRAAVAPPLPAPAATAILAWRTTGLADGTHTLAAQASDRAGNTAGVRRVVIVDNTPPETERRSGPEGAIATSTATFGFAGTDNLTPEASLRFAWRLDGGPLSPFTSATSVTLEQLAPGDHVFEAIARDLAGNEDPTPARWEFSVRTTAVALAITAPAPGATLPIDEVLVRGTVEAGAVEVRVTVNGLAALVHGAQWAVQVPIVAGENLLAAVARTSAGAQSTATLSVTGSGDGPDVALRAEPSSGLAPLTVRWRLTSRASRPLVRFELDTEGTGVFGPPAAALDGAESTYASPGLRFPTVRATDDQGHVHVATTLVHADDALAAAARFRALWTGFQARLQAGDQSGALAHLTPALQARFAPILQELGPALPAAAGGLGTVELIDQVGDLAEGAILSHDEDGVTRLYFVYFHRDPRGQWLIQEM